MKQSFKYLLLSYFCLVGTLLPLIGQSPTLFIQSTCLATSKFVESSNTWNNDDCKTPTTNIYYVTPDALTTGTGARTCPWVLDTAVAKAVAGDIVYVLAGNYGAKSLTFPNSGTSAAPIHFIGCTTFPSLGAIGQTDIAVTPPLSSFEDFLNNEIEHTNASVMPLLNGEYMVNRAMNISYRAHLQIKNFSITNYVEAGIQGESFLNKVVLKNITVTNIGSNIPNGETVECDIGDGELDDETNEPFCGYGIELYGDSCLIEECIVVNAGAHNISCWRGTGHHILNCKSYGNLKATNGADYYILINQGDHNKIEGCYVERQDGLTHKGHGIGFTHASFNEVLNCTVKNSKEGFYARGDAHYNIFKNCKTLEEYADGRQGEFPAVHIRDGASYNQFINCHFKNASVAVRVLGSVILEDYKGELVGIGTGHHSLFYNCLFDRPRTHIELREHLTNDCLGLKNCAAGIGCDPTLNPCLTCADELSANGCLNCMDLQDCVDSLVADPGYIEGGHLFINCIFMGEGTVNDNLIITNQRDTIATDTNRIINSIIYDISSYRACTNGTTLNKLYTATPPTFFPDAADCKNTVDCCPDFINKASVSPDYFKIQNSLIHKNSFFLPHFVPNFAADNNVSGDPEFIDLFSNYQLSCNSPAINAGMDPSSLLVATFGDSLASDIPLFDFDGVTRPLENLHDMGIYEQTLGSQNSLVTSETTLNSFYRNKGAIASDGSVPMGQSTKIFSETSITLTSNFHATAGSDFLAKIEVCNPRNLQAATNRNDVTTNVPIPSPTEVFPIVISPNPFTASITITLDLPVATSISLQLVDNTGRNIHSILPTAYREKGQQEFFYAAHDLATGAYWVRVITEYGVYVKRVVLVR